MPHLCPWWLGYLLVNPLRRFWQAPDAILGPYVRPGMTALDFGCGMGYFGLPLAALVGAEGRVVCLDVQPRMLAALRRRAARAALAGRIDARLNRGGQDAWAGLTGQVDFALAFAVMHEVCDAQSVLQQLRAVLAPDGRLLLSEPRGHVGQAAFARTVAEAERAHLRVIDRPSFWRMRTVVLATA